VVGRKVGVVARAELIYYSDLPEVAVVVASVADALLFAFLLQYLAVFP
jgi:hypothetical protein